MDNVYHAAAIYIFLLIIFRFAGKRTLTEITTFDLVLTLIISEATQQAMVNNDHSITGAIVLITTLVGLDIGLSLLKQRFHTLAKIVDGVPVIIFKHGKLVRTHAAKERVDETDVLSAARRIHGLERLDQIKYAIVEESGGISIIPIESARA